MIFKYNTIFNEIGKEIPSAGLDPQLDTPEPQPYICLGKVRVPMLDIQTIRSNPDMVKAGLKRVGADPLMVDKVLEIDVERRKLQKEGDELRSDLNRRSKEIGRTKDPEERKKLIEDVSGVKGRIKTIESLEPELDERLKSLMLDIPNLPLDEVPDGPDDSANVVEKVYGKPPALDFEPKPHWDLLQSLGLIDFERGQKISGSRFYFLKKEGAQLQRALITFMLDVHTKEHGYTELYPPYMVRSECLVGTANLPKFGDNLYHDAEEDFWWVPTAEVPVTNFHREEILNESELPKRYTAYSACFRREKMSHGKDTRGIKRGHQFDKVELVHLEKPEESRAALDFLLESARDILVRLGLQHRVVKMCAGDLSFVACVKFDLEAWAPGCGEWLEVSSCGLFGDFQARRAQIRYRTAEDKKVRFVHTLNGSGLALPRVMISLVESYQTKDGRIRVPEALRPYLDGREYLC